MHSTETVAVAFLSMRNRMQAIHARHSSVPIGIRNLKDLFGQILSKLDLHACKQQRKSI